MGDSNHPGADGLIFKTYAENSTNDVTVHVKHNFYIFDVQREEIAIDPMFRNSGAITQRETNGVGCDPTLYDNLTNFFLTTSLGPGTVLATNGYFYNLQETDATVPTNAAVHNGWVWRQDAAFKIFYWKHGEPDVLGVDPTLKTFPSGPPGSGDGNDNPTIWADNSPDLNGLILAFDGPGMHAPSGQYADSDVAAYRFYARQWATWGGVRVTPILRWRSFITIKKTSEGWIRAGDNFIDEKPEDDPEVPRFDVLKAQQVYQQ
jgi:hypothetical protein